MQSFTTQTGPYQPQPAAPPQTFTTQTGPYQQQPAAYPQQYMGAPTPGVLSEAAAAYMGMPMPYAPGFSRIAGFTPAQYEGWATQLGGAQNAIGAARQHQALAGNMYGQMTSGGPGSLIGGAGTSFDQNLFQQLGGGASPLEYTPIMNFFNNPYVDQMVQGAAGDVTQNYRRNIAPGIGTAALGTGNYGSSRQGIAEGIAQSDLNRQIGDISSGIRGQAYAQGLGAYGQDRATTLSSQLQNRGQAIGAAQQSAAQNAANWGQALSGAQTLQGIAMSPYQYQQQFGQLQGNIGAQQQALNQARLGEAGQDYMQNIQAPWQHLGNYAGLVTRMPLGQFGNTNVQNAQDNPVFQNPSLYMPQVAGVTPAQTSPMQAGIGGGLAAWSLYNQGAFSGGGGGIQ